MKRWIVNQIQNFRKGRSPMLGLWLIIIFGGVSIFVLPVIFTLPSFLPSFSETGPIGDTINGIAGPFIALIAAGLTFLAFWVQFLSNKEQKNQFKKQADDTLIERFENRFFEMVRLHRANVDEQNIQDIIKGRKVFTTYYFELRYIYFVLTYYYDTNKPTKELDKEQLTNIAYLIFFFGIGHVTDSVFNHLTPSYINEVFFKNTIKRLESEKERYARGIRNDLVIAVGDKKAIFKQVYQPFTGHGTKIGHYYRHLFQTVKYVSEQKNKVFTDKLKYSYVKILQAQLSNFEQVMFYYNAVSLLGKRWIENGYVKDYRLVTNLPLSFADFGILPEEKFEKEVKEVKDFFQWHTLKNELIS